jgi:hypothetical protein
VADDIWALGDKVVGNSSDLSTEHGNGVGLDELLGMMALGDETVAAIRAGSF